VHGLRGSLHLTFEEGTWAAWLYDLLKPHVTKLVVCDPRRNGYTHAAGAGSSCRISGSLLRRRLVSIQPTL
jgi:hypothetical protein